MKKELQSVVLNTPKKLNLLQLFPDTEIRNKAIFILHEINHWTNKKGEYNLDKTKHRNFLALESSQFTNIKKVLVDNCVIKLTKRYIPKVQSEHYAMVTPFDIKAESISQKNYFVLSSKDCPRYIKKWLEYGYHIVKPENKENTFQLISTIKLNEMDKNYKELLDAYRKVQDENKALKAYKKSKEVQTPVEAKTIQPVAVKETIEPVINMADKEIATQSWKQPDTNTVVIEPVISIPECNFKLAKSSGEIKYTACGKDGIINMNIEFYNILKMYSPEKIEEFLFVLNAINKPQIEFSNLKLSKVIKDNIVRIDFLGIKQVA